MSWSEQCKIAFRTEASVYIARGEKLKPCLRRLAKETDIPFDTLKRWYYEPQPEKTKVDPASPQNVVISDTLETTKWDELSNAKEDPTTKPKNGGPRPRAGKKFDNPDNVINKLASLLGKLIPLTLNDSHIERLFEHCKIVYEIIEDNRNGLGRTLQDRE